MPDPDPASDRDDASVWRGGWADLYDAMDVDRTPHISFYASLVTPATRSLLDLGCGTGSITMAMAARMPEAARVVGVDLSPEMIAVARARAPAHDWRVGDLTAPPVEETFDLIVICFHTLQVLLDDADLARCFRGVAARLAPGGRFAFDLYRPNLPWLMALGPGPAVARRFADASGRRFEVIERDGAYDPVARVLSGSWTLHDAATGERMPLAPIVQRIRQYFPEDIERALDAAGLAVAERHGDLDRRPFAEDAKRQVYVCTAAGTAR